MLSPFLKKLLFARQLYLADGELKILGKRQVMLPIEVLSALQSIDPEKCYDVVKETVKISMQEYAKKIGSTNEGMLSIMEDIFETFGLGKPEILNLDNAKKTVILRIKNSPQKEQVQKTTLKDYSVSRGALAGMFSFLFKENLDCDAKLAGTVMECTIHRRAAA